MNQNENILGTEKISKLVRKFAIPCVVSMVVAALYNIVDQIYIGWSSAGAFGNAATNIVYPVTVLALGLALLVGDGSAANFSLFLGAKDNKNANKSVGNGLTLLIIFSVIVTVAYLLFQTQFLAIFGGDPKEKECYSFAKDYYWIIALGMPFYMIGQGLNGVIRADGSPRYAMACTLAGAITNIIFDPIFIFAFNMSVKGAAIATVLGQIVTFVMSIVYLFKSKDFKISLDSMKLSGKIVPKLATVGLASLIVQVSIVAIIAVNNNLFTKFGYETKALTGEFFGAITPLAVIGIVLKVFGIVVSIAIGIGLGGQPIIGYNMGAGDIVRVKKTISYILKAVVIVGVISMLIFEFFPDLIIATFGNNNTPEYIEFARDTIRIFLSGIILTCCIKSISIMLQSMGNSVKSVFTALTRDFIVFIPATTIIAFATHSIISMLWAALIADVIGALVAFVLLYTEIKKFEKSLNK